jgi:hypothetical protein
MNKKYDDALYKELTRISTYYFGPTTDRILAALIKNHLHKTPGMLTKRDIRTLSDWLELSLSIVSDDKAEIDQYLHKVKKLYGK